MASTLTYFVSPSILIGIAVCACVLLLVAIMGLYGTIKHHQVTMFFVSLHCRRDTITGLVVNCIHVCSMYNAQD